MYFVLYMKKVQTGLVIEFYSNSCLVKVGDINLKCIAIKGVVVGDMVEIEVIQDSNEIKGKIINLLPRISSIKKKDGYRSKIFAANISKVGIIVSPKPITNEKFIDKWIITAKLSNIEPFIINNKIDLNQDKKYRSKINIYKEINIKVIDISSKEEINLAKLKDFLRNESVLFVGKSGAGKSTLTKSITGKNIKTNLLSNDKGVHTTSLSTLYEIPGNTKIIDSPGVRDVTIAGWGREKIIIGFSEIFEYAKNCKFKNCSHTSEEGCGVLQAIKNGEIHETRYNNFIKFRDSVDE